MLMPALVEVFSNVNWTRSEPTQPSRMSLKTKQLRNGPTRSESLLQLVEHSYVSFNALYTALQFHGKLLYADLS